MGDYLPKFSDPFTVVATGVITGGRLLNVAGTQTTADDPTFTGVASHDAAIGKKVGCYPLPGRVHRLVAAAAIAKGARVKPAANGQVATFVSGTDADQLIVGKTLQAAVNPGDVIEVLGA